MSSCYQELLVVEIALRVGGNIAAIKKLTIPWGFTMVKRNTSELFHDLHTRGKSFMRVNVLVSTGPLTGTERVPVGDVSCRCMLWSVASV